MRSKTANNMTPSPSPSPTCESEKESEKEKEKEKETDDIYGTDEDEDEEEAEDEPMRGAHMASLESYGLTRFPSTPRNSGGQKESKN